MNALRYAFSFFAGTVIFGLGGPVQALPLTMAELYELNLYVQCTEGCTVPVAGGSYADHLRYAECRALCACGDACPKPDRPTAAEQLGYEACLAACPQPPRTWEKDGTAPVDRHDLDLAFLEADDQESDVRLICYRDADRAVVVPAPLCGGDTCVGLGSELSCDEAACTGTLELVCELDGQGEPDCWYSATSRRALCLDSVCQAGAGEPLAFNGDTCDDGDRDGLPRWLEDFKPGYSDETPNALCSPAAPCAFTETCVYDDDLGGGTCAPRNCPPEGHCTAFHLERVAEDDTQTVLHLHYDYSPVPARVLDLYLVFDRSVLTLEDARPLTPLKLLGKRVASSFLADGTLRVTVYDPDGSHPIPNGPIVELVFQHQGAGGCTVAFTSDPELRAKAIAPLQGTTAIQAELAAVAAAGELDLWGAPIAVAERRDIGTQLRLWYGFDSADAPLSYANIPNADDICADLPDCVNETDAVEQAKVLARLDHLQAGEFASRANVAGITGHAAYLNGASDHLRLPVDYDRPLSFADQGFSFSTWFYTEGNSAAEPADTPQILFSHNAFNERTRFGLWLKPDAVDGGMRLALFVGDVLSVRPTPEEWVLQSGIRLQTWHHAGFSLDASTGYFDVYFDGEPVTGFSRPARIKTVPYVSCPQFNAGREVRLHEEGSDVLGARPPDYLYLAADRTNLYQVERTDLAGLQTETVIGDGQFNYRDPDYYPPLDRLVFSSNAGGSDEIWIAEGDGSNPQRITSGFGDAARGIYARRPRWAPDGSAIVFESNVFDVLQNDNLFAQVYHLYYVGYDAAANVVAVELADGSTTTELDYAARLTDQTIADYRLTHGSLDRHHMNARWLTGTNPDDGSRGVLLMDTAAADFKSRRIYRLTIPAIVALATAEELPGVVSADEQDVAILAAHHSEQAASPAPLVVERLLFSREYPAFANHGVVRLEPTVGTTEVTLKVYTNYAASGMASDCWDRNGNDACDPDEDRDEDSDCDTADCPPHELRDLFIPYDGDALRPALFGSDGLAQTPAPGLTSRGKTLRLGDVYPGGRAMVKVEFLSPLNATPLPYADTLLATLHFARRAGHGAPDTGQFAALKRTSVTDYWMKDLRSAGAPLPLRATSQGPGATPFEEIHDATFSPTGDRLVLAAFSRSRPVLLRTPAFNMLGTAIDVSKSERLTVQPTEVSGLTWVHEQRYYACNWVGGHLHFQSKLVVDGLRGGLDDLKIFRGIRDPAAFRSEAERGREFAVQSGIGGTVESQLPVCSASHVECPPFHVCSDGQCRVQPCSPTDPSSCAAYGARCTLRPLSVEVASGAGYEWVCAADCTVDSQCFSEACANGPCRFCDVDTLSCIECRESVEDIGGLLVSTIEGCPDRKSYTCVGGSCQTECYATVGERTVYLCDAATEYCDRGQCVLLDWDWWDFAPASFSGAGEVHYDVPPDPANGWFAYSQAVDQRVPVSVVAYGSEDYGFSPELVVEARGGPFFGSQWHRVADIYVHNRTRTEAELRPYTFASPYPFNDLRLRLVTSPYQNMTGAATGLGDSDKDFCYDDWAGTPGADPDNPVPCHRQAQGSQYVMGYAVGVPESAAIQYCNERGYDGCLPLAAGELDFIPGGRPGVVLVDLQVDGGGAMNNITSNTVCSYEGGLLPSENGVRKKVYYGHVATERSNEAVAYCAQTPGHCTPNHGLIQFDRDTYGFALLNCNVYDPAWSEQAGILVQNIVIQRQWPAQAGAVVLDDGDVCTVEVDTARLSPCYAWTGSDASVDPYSAETEVFASFELGLFRSFGHDEGFLSVALGDAVQTAVVRNYFGTSLALQLKEIGIESPQTHTVTVGTPAPPGSAVTVSFPASRVGTRYEASISAQPGREHDQCAILQNATGTIGAGLAIEVDCYPQFTVGGTLQNLAEGTVTLALEITGDDGTTVSEYKPLTAQQTGPYTFDTLLRAGQSYAVSVHGQPSAARCALGPGVAGAGVISAANVTNVVVGCRTVQPRNLTVTVEGLEDSGLTLVERTTGTRTVVVPPTPAVDSFVQTVVPLALVAGDAYEVIISAQPTNPLALPQQCELRLTSGQTAVNRLVGTMDTLDLGDTSAGEVHCSRPTACRVDGTVVGLPAGAIVALGLNDGAAECSVTGTASLTEPVAFTFDPWLRAGTPFTVTVRLQPTTPPTVCSVLPAAGLTSYASCRDEAEVQVVCVRTTDTRVYTLGGRVQGLAAGAQGLRLNLNSNAERLQLSENGPFTFVAPLLNDSDYDVVVDRHPNNPVQYCEIENGTGTIAGESVADLVVTCVDGAKLAVQVNRGDAEGARVEAFLVRPGTRPSIVARSPQTAEIVNGKADFTFQDPDREVDAILPVGDYELFVLVNSDNSFDPFDNRPLFNPGTDLGMRQVVSIAASGNEPVVLASSALRPLLSGAVSASFGSAAVPANAVLRCLWLAENRGPVGDSTYQLLLDDDSFPLLGLSQAECADPNGETCYTDGVVTTAKRVDGLTADVRYDLTCWLDMNADNHVGQGDLYAFERSVTPTAEPRSVQLRRID